MKESPFIAVLKRELDRMVSRRIYFASCIVLPFPTFRITRHYADEVEARADVQRKSIYGYLSIPSGFEAKVMDGKETALTYYYHYALMSVGSEIHGAFQSLLKSISLMLWHWV